MNLIKAVPTVYLVAYYDAVNDDTRIQTWFQPTLDRDAAVRYCERQASQAEAGSKYWVVDAEGRCCSEVVHGTGEW